MKLALLPSLLLLLPAETAGQASCSGSSLQTQANQLTATCCPPQVANSCVRGVPRSCSRQCAAVVAPFVASCRAALAGTSVGTTLASLASICAVSGAGAGCGTLSPPNARVPRCATSTTGATCVAQCMRGFAAAIAGHRRVLQDTSPTATYTCGADGQWRAAGECTAAGGGSSPPAGGGTAAVGVKPSDPTMMTLNNGVEMPLVSFGFEVYDDATARRLMGVAIGVGYRNFFASVLANNQIGAGQGITDAATAGVPREELFICGSVTQCRTSMDDAACYQYTADMAARNLRDLGLPYLDQIMLDYPPDTTCTAATCASISAQWRAFEDMQRRGETLSIAVSNYCPCQIECITSDPTRIVPTVNQLKFHVGMGADPAGGFASNYAADVIPQAYSPLGHGHRTLTAGPLTTGIARRYSGKSAAQVSYKWLQQKGVSICMSSTSQAHFIEDIDLFSWTLTDADMALLDGATSPGGDPAACYSRQISDCRYHHINCPGTGRRLADAAMMHVLGNGTHLP